MKAHDIDTRFITERSGPTETTCDKCGEVILPSEDRHIVKIDEEQIWCCGCLFDAIDK